MNQILIGLMLLTPCLGFSQTNHADKIIDVYGQEWFDHMSDAHPAVIELLDAYAGYGMVVQQMEADKGDEFKPLQVIPLREKTAGSVTVEAFLNEFAGESFNPLRYGFFPGKDLQTYRLEGTNWIIYILPQDDILQKNNQE